MYKFLFFYIKLLAFASCLCLLGGASYAQPTLGVGPQVGVNVSTCLYQGNPNLYATPYLVPTYRVGPEAGVKVSLDFQHFALQSALLYSQKGFGLKAAYTEAFPGGDVSTTIDEQTRLSYLTVPVNIAYTFRPKGQGWQVFAGAYVGTLLGGRVRYSRSTTIADGSVRATQSDRAVKAGSEDQNDGYEYFQRYDAGVQAGVGYRYQHFLAQADYSVGLANAGVSFPSNTPTFRDGPTYRNRGFQLAVSYLFKK